jgi:flagellar biosynthetic protein FlhB/flagellar biosynthesis protein
MSDDPKMAIAIDYDTANDNAPRVVAKGMRLKAEKIREIAKAYDVPIMRNVALAGALYKVEIGEEVPEELYDAVAEVLNFIFALEKEQKGKK